jgi:uncharacterized protein
MTQFRMLCFLVPVIALALVAAALFARSIPHIETEAWPVENIYQGKTIVTGQRDETRIPGFKRALVDALKKASGDPAISEDEVLAAIGSSVQTYVMSYSEHDRMADIPIHDEQGTRDRPFDLAVDFHREKIDGLLKTLGRSPWADARPETLVLLVVHFDANSYVLTSDEDLGIDQRDALIATAWQAGLPISLPTAAGVGRAGLTPDALFPATAQYVEVLRRRLGIGHLMVGSIVWKSGMRGWKAVWDFDAGGQIHHWQIQDVNFDDAFRSAMRGAAQILSGHGEPQDGLT